MTPNKERDITLGLGKKFEEQFHIWAERVMLTAVTAFVTSCFAFMSSQAYNLYHRYREQPLSAKPQRTLCQAETTNLEVSKRQLLSPSGTRGTVKKPNSPSPSINNNDQKSRITSNVLRNILVDTIKSLTFGFKNFFTFGFT